MFFFLTPALLGTSNMSMHAHTHAPIFTFKYINLTSYLYFWILETNPRISTKSVFKPCDIFFLQCLN